MHVPKTFSLPYSFAASQGFYFCPIWNNKEAVKKTAPLHHKK